MCILDCGGREWATMRHTERTGQRHKVELGYSVKEISESQLPSLTITLKYDTL